MRIDLAKHTRGSIHFAGEGFGRMARDSARLNLHEEMHPRIINVIPEEITSIHFSFFKRDVRRKHETHGAREIHAKVFVRDPPSYGRTNPKLRPSTFVVREVQ